MTTANRTRFLQVLGATEAVAAFLVALFSISLPGADEVQSTFDGARDLAHVSRRHVETLQLHTETLRAGTHELATTLTPLSEVLSTATGTELPALTLDGGGPRLRWSRVLPEQYDPAERLAKIAAASAASEQVLADLAHDLPGTQASLAEMESALDRYGSQTARSLTYGRWLLWMVVAIAGLHGLFLVGSAHAA